MSNELNSGETSVSVQQHPGVYCDGVVQWEDNKFWWSCHKCGYCGGGADARHKQVTNPLMFLLHGLGYFIRKRAEQSATVKDTGIEAVYVVGSQLRNTADQDQIPVVDVREHYVP